MSAFDEHRPYKAENGKIYSWIEGRSYYDVDWGQCYERGYYIEICDDTPENRKYYNIND